MLSQYPGHKCHSHWRLAQAPNYKIHTQKHSIPNTMKGDSEKNMRIYNTSRYPATGIKVLRIVIFLTKFSDMSNLFDVANKNVRGDGSKKN